MLHLIDHPVSAAPAGCLHLHLSDSGVRHAEVHLMENIKNEVLNSSPSGEHDHVTRPPEQGLCLTEPLSRQHSLCGGLGGPWQENIQLDFWHKYKSQNTWYVVSEWRGHLDLETRHIPDGKSKYTTQGHQEPEM